MLKLLRYILVLGIIGAIGAGIYIYTQDRQPPTVTLMPQPGPLGMNDQLTLTVADPSGLRDVKVFLIQGQTRLAVIEKDFSTARQQYQTKIPLAAPALQDGPLSFEIQAGDRSIYHLGNGNQVQRRVKYQLDRQPPMLTVLSRQHNIYQGGSALIVYKSSEALERTGMQVGDQFYPAYQQADGRYFCLFAWPSNQGPEALSPRLIAADAAGNTSQGTFYYNVIPKHFPADRITISQRFLSRKMPQFRAQFPQTTSGKELFLQVNRQLRQQNRSRLHQYAQQSQSRLQVQQPFLRQPNAATKADFGEHRNYYYQGQKIDEQTHLGIDLASTAAAPVPACASGKVVFAGNFGIYGNCVIIDHGLGLQTLYGHLSQYSVNKGQQIQRGQIIGRTGATGLAGGDHLHLGVLVGGQPVNPIEWWDDNWFKNNIVSKIKQKQ